jgi:hypothetical protein
MSGTPSNPTYDPATLPPAAKPAPVAPEKPPLPTPYNTNPSSGARTETIKPGSGGYGVP